MIKKIWLNVLEQAGIEDILTCNNYNEDYSHEVHLTVKEIREIALLLGAEVNLEEEKLEDE